jgi:hypothetical protein
MVVSILNYTGMGTVDWSVVTTARVSGACYSSTVAASVSGSS